jgi:predicted nuclease of predicted toxin-antitoxin system
MELLADQDVYKVTIDQLRKWGHNVVTVKELGMQGAIDKELLRKARIEKRLLITRDKGFGTLAFLHKALFASIIVLKITPVILEEVHQEIQRLLAEHTEEGLRTFLCVVEPHRHRIRHLL